MAEIQDISVRFFVPRTLLDIVGGGISIKYGFKGMNFSVVAACASSTIALIDAMNYIRLRKSGCVDCRRL
jgi:3-oxoacyl-[acyl-carrier-protein] synthase II